MDFKNNIVSVRYENRKTGGYSEHAYSYYSEVPDLKPGAIVKVPTRYGTSKAIVEKVGISEATLPAALRARLKTITAECLVVEGQGQDQQQMSLGSLAAENFFK